MNIPGLKTQWLQKWLKPNLIWLLPIALAGFIAIYWDQTPNSKSSNQSNSQPEAADTYIPAGYVLVPIEVANYESLDSILGQFGVVDLYTPAPPGGGRPIRVAEKIKILRAPLNPNHFAVLAPEDESPRLVSHQGPFTVVVLNPRRAGTGLEKTRFPSQDESSEKIPKNRRKARIEVENTDAI